MLDKLQFLIERPGTRVAVTQWGQRTSKKPIALLVHGTGFVAGVWDEIANGLAKNYLVYAFDRRGHGQSGKLSAHSYHFQDFAVDVCAVMDELDLSDVLGVGHSAGGTDLLLAAGIMPRRFSRIFVIEPTVMNPNAQRVEGAQLSEAAKAFVRKAAFRRSEFETADAALVRLRSSDAFSAWSEPALQAYVRCGFERLDDGRIRLLCTPEVESEMLSPIFEAMEQVYTGDARGNPFSLLEAIDCRVCIGTAERSACIYKEMALRAVSMVPRASEWRFDGVGHCVAQEAPALLLRAIKQFAHRVR